MHVPVRKSFALLLCFAALGVASLLLTYHVSIEGVYAFYRGLRGAQVWFGGVWGFLLLFAALPFFYPPVIPYLRLRGTRAWRRLGSDRGPLYDGLAKLRHLETHADHLQVGRMARQLGDHKLALEHLGRAFTLDPTHVSGRYQFALLLGDLGRWGDATNLLGSVVDADESHAFGDALLRLGTALFRLHRDSEALTVLRRHQVLFPGNRQVHLLLARVLASLGDLDAARVDLQQAAKPPTQGVALSLEESLARARARVTVLKKGKAHA